MPLNPMIQMQVKMVKQALRGMKTQEREEVFKSIRSEFCVNCGLVRPKDATECIECHSEFPEDD